MKIHRYLEKELNYLADNTYRSPDGSSTHRRLIPAETIICASLNDINGARLSTDEWGINGTIDICGVYVAPPGHNRLVDANVSFVIQQSQAYELVEDEFWDTDHVAFKFYDLAYLGLYKGVREKIPMGTPPFLCTQIAFKWIPSWDWAVPICGFFAGLDAGRQLGEYFLQNTNDGSHLAK